MRNESLSSLIAHSLFVDCRTAAPKQAPLKQLSRAILPVANQVLFSSVASFTGAQGQGNYVAANAALDAYAASQAAAGMPVRFNRFVIAINQHC